MALFRTAFIALDGDFIRSTTGIGVCLSIRAIHYMKL